MYDVSLQVFKMEHVVALFDVTLHL